jgi:sRNA-binding protein
MKKKRRAAYRYKLAACLVDIYALWPALKRREPLATGVHRLVATVLAQHYPAWLVRRALHEHCAQEPYLRNVLAGGYRHDLFGASTAELITEDQRKDAARHLEERRRKRAQAKRFSGARSPSRRPSR